MVEQAIEIVNVRDTLKQFAIEMERRLRKNEWKGGWEDLSRREIFQSLIDESMSLWSAIEERNSERIKKKSVDVANFSMMLYHNEIIRQDKKKGVTQDD